MIKNFLMKVKDDKIGEISAQSAYYITLSLIPFLLVFISLVQYLNIDKNLLLENVREVIPLAFHDMAFNIIEEIYSKTLTTISISAIFAIWSASKGFFTIIKGIHKIYKIEENYIYYKVKSVVFTALFLTLLIVISAFLVLENNINNMITNYLPEGTANIIIWLKRIAMPIIIFIVFLLFYKFTPHCKLKLKNQIFGSLFVTFFWYLLSNGLSLYININKGFSILYGSLTTIILFLIWIYYLIYIILIGAEINYFRK